MKKELPINSEPPIRIYSYYAYGHAITGNMSAQDVATMKTGAIYPDANWGGIDLLGENPLWHGGYLGGNYVSSYIYITRISKVMQNGKAPSTAAIPAGLSSGDAQSIRTAISNMNWHILARNQHERGLYVWGMAIHTATDVYAHSAHAYVYCLKEKKKVWGHLDHYTHNLLADISGGSGTANEFFPSSGYSGAGGSSGWKIINLKENVNVHNSALSSSPNTYSTYYNIYK